MIINLISKNKLLSLFLGLFFLSVFLWPDQTRAAFNFTSDLEVGARGSAVKVLQILLNLPNITGYFGEQTSRALKQFQNQHSIVDEMGYLGSQTRQIFNQMLGYQMTVATSTTSLSVVSTSSTLINLKIPAKPNLVSSSPARGRAGQTITLVGSGFTSFGNQVYTGSSIINNIPSADGQTLTFYLDYPPGWSANLTDSDKTKTITLPLWFYVKNQNGLSNNLIFNLILP